MTRPRPALQRPRLDVPLRFSVLGIEREQSPLATPGTVATYTIPSATVGVRAPVSADLAVLAVGVDSHQVVTRERLSSGGWVNTPVERCGYPSNPTPVAHPNTSSGTNMRRTIKTARIPKPSSRRTPADRCRFGGRDSAIPENANAIPKNSITWGPSSTIPKYTHPRRQPSEKSEKTRPFRRPSGSRNNIRRIATTPTDRSVSQ